MDPSLYKETQTSRGLTYRYYHAPARAGRPTLLLCHGFPSTAHDWRRLAPRLQERGYGVVAPDMLGFGGTAKPTDPAAYVPSAMSRDLADVLDAAGIDKVVAIGHDWGAKAVSRLANWFPERIIAAAFLAVPYISVTPPINFEVFLEMQRKELGFETFGYWLFYSEPDADAILQAHLDAFVSLAWPHDPELWRTRFAPVGALKRSLLEDFTGPLPAYVSPADKTAFVETFRRNGFTAPTCWYKVMTSGMSACDDEQIPYERRLPPQSAPLFFGGAKNDYICLAQTGYAVFGSEVFKEYSVTTKEYDADHWLILSTADEIARDLDAWIEGTVLKTSRL
ncbi:alpha/beta hydrolase [Phanerochaete sordida]|uniref:Alpha/beta hydrolase n=1 Tax=Phanerochaete sordida TaxID=48140 RepID=A0A9P3GBG8_9APHY|nr:alpha/beta hydrolase [Phanerochaete sordida]